MDKLGVTNIKLWFAMDKLYAAGKNNRDLEAAYVKQVASLNLQRNQLMTEIDQTFDRGLKEGGAAVDPRVKIT